MAKTVSGRDQGDERKRTIVEVSKYQRRRRNCGYLDVWHAASCNCIRRKPRLSIVRTQNALEITSMRVLIFLAIAFDRVAVRVAAILSALRQR
jgi:hypothetical protein